MTTDTKPLAWFSWSLNSNTGLSTSGSQDGITPEMYGAIMGVLAGRFPESEIARLQAQVDAFAEALRKVSVIGNDDGLSRDEYQQRLIAAAGYARVALSAVGR